MRAVELRASELSFRPDFEEPSPVDGEVIVRKIELTQPGQDRYGRQVTHIRQFVVRQVQHFEIQTVFQAAQVIDALVRGHQGRERQEILVEQDAVGDAHGGPHQLFERRIAEYHDRGTMGNRRCRHGR